MNRFIILIILTFIISCDDESESRSLPPITNTGENTFGFKANGEVWLPSTRSFCGGGFDLNSNFGELGSELSTRITAYDCENKAGMVKRLQMKYFFTSKILDSVIIETSFRDESKRQDVGDYHRYTLTESLENNFYDISLTKTENENLIFSGRFEFDIYDTILNKNFEFREGRFDVLCE